LRGFKEDFINTTRLFEDIFREMEASVKKCGAFIKISIIFENIFREIEAFSRIARLFKYIFNGIEAFLKWCEAVSAMSQNIKCLLLSKIKFYK
jgi:hypothetical protein